MSELIEIANVCDNGCVVIRDPDLPGPPNRYGYRMFEELPVDVFSGQPYRWRPTDPYIEPPRTVTR